MAEITADGLPVVTNGCITKTWQDMYSSFCGRNDTDFLKELAEIMAENPHFAAYILRIWHELNRGEPAEGEYAANALVVAYKSLKAQAQANKMGEEINGPEEEQATTGQGTDK